MLKTLFSRAAIYVVKTSKPATSFASPHARWHRATASKVFLFLFCGFIGSFVFSEELVFRKCVCQVASVMSDPLQPHGL